MIFFSFFEPTISAICYRVQLLLLIIVLRGFSAILLLLREKEPGQSRYYCININTINTIIRVIFMELVVLCEKWKRNRLSEIVRKPIKPSLHPPNNRCSTKKCFEFVLRGIISCSHDTNGSAVQCRYYYSINSTRSMYYSISIHASNGMDVRPRESQTRTLPRSYNISWLLIAPDRREPHGKN